MTLRVERAPAKVNLILQVGDPRADGLHPLCSLFGRLELADELSFESAAGAQDVVRCPGVTGENLAARALAGFRSRVGRGAGPDPLAVAIAKRIPVAAGLGGGSADAAAVLRVANELAGAPLELDELRALGATVGADVPSQVEPAHALVHGAGEVVEPLDVPSLAIVLVPRPEGLSTAAVYAELDRLRAAGTVPRRARLEPEPLREAAAAGVEGLASALHNDLEPAALSLAPGIAATLDHVRDAGALVARVTGSGPTVFGVMSDDAAAAQVAAAIPGAIATRLA